MSTFSSALQGVKKIWPFLLKTGQYKLIYPILVKALNTQSGLSSSSVLVEMHAMPLCIEFGLKADYNVMIRSYPTMPLDYQSKKKYPLLSKHAFPNKYNLFV